MRKIITGILLVSSSAAFADNPVGFISNTLKDVQSTWVSGKTSTLAESAMTAVKSRSPGALKQLEKIAHGGDPDAQNMMGWLYDNGEYGVLADPSGALKYFTAAASQGNEIAMYNIGVLTNYGRGVPLNVEKAYQWFERASRSKIIKRACVRAAVIELQQQKDPVLLNTHVQCATDLGSGTGFYLRGKMEYKAGQYSSAASWLNRAADTMEPNAPWIMSQLYSNTPGLVKDRALAAAWWQIAAKQNPKAAGVNAAGYANFGLTEEEQYKANHFVQTWYKSHTQVAPINYAKTILTVKE